MYSTNVYWSRIGTTGKSTRWNVDTSISGFRYRWECCRLSCYSDKVGTRPEREVDKVWRTGKIDIHGEDLAGAAHLVRKLKLASHQAGP